MTKRVGPSDADLIIKFGSGLNTRASEEEIAEREAADGSNFLLDLENRQLRNRPPFDLVGTVPNASEIRGGGSLLKSDGSVQTFFQGGTVAYEWDGTDFTSIATGLNATAKLRGHWRTHNWQLDDKLIITDLNLAERVKEWDGTTFQNASFLSNPSTSFGNFFAKYVTISNERAMFANVKDASTTTPHMIVGSKRGDFLTISVSDRPSSAIAVDDPWFLLAEDLRPINGVVSAFGTTVFSTERGEVYKLTGENSQDFAIGDFYPGSFASGDESVAYIGNDIIYGRQGRIESIRDTDRFGDVETDDITRNISDQVKDYTGWTTVYNSRLNRVYLFPEGQSEVWVFQTAMRDQGEESPWMRWVTAHSLAFQPSFVFSGLDPSDNLEYVFMGDSSGNVYRLEGTGTSGDGGTSQITTTWLSKLFSVPSNAQAFDVQGEIKYRKDAAATVTLTFEYAGEAIFTESLDINIPAATGAQHYGGDTFYGGDFYYGTAAGRLTRQKFFQPGQGNEFQVRVSVTGNTDFEINEITLRFKAASQ